MNIQMNIKQQPLFKLSAQQDLILFLIEKELYGMKLVDGLVKLGFDSSYHYPDLGIAILSLMGIEQLNDEVWDRYHELVKKYESRVSLSDGKANSQIVMEFYIELRAKY